jgi:hypothetical protein
VDGSGKVYKVTLQPLTTSNYFAPATAAHRSVEQQLPALRSQPEHRRQQLRRSKGVVAHNAVHHSKQYPSSLTVTVVKRSTPSTAGQAEIGRTGCPSRLSAPPRYSVLRNAINARLSSV